MELIELLDKIDETAPRTCQTCLYMATHEHCKGCLGPADVKEFLYTNWKPGNWLKRMNDFERTGKRNIVIGGQGEAEVNVKQTPAEASKNLHQVAKCCGYTVDSLRCTASYTGLQLDIWTSAGWFRLYWDTTDKNEPGKLHHIDRLNGNNKPARQSWPNELNG